MNHFKTEEEVRTKGKMIAITTLSVIGILVIVVIISILSVKSFFNNLAKHEYYILEINDDNRDEIINLLEQEKENMFYNSHYCSSMYKIEYTNLFPDGTDYTIYCKDEENISFSIDKAGEDKLQNYIYKNGTTESR